MSEDLSYVCLYVCFTLTKALPLRRHRSRSRQRALLITHTFIIYKTILTSKHLNLIFVEVVRYLPYLSDFMAVKLGEDWCRYRLYTCNDTKSISVRLWPQQTASLVSVSFTQEGSAMCCGTNSAKHFSLFMTMRLSHWPSLTTGRSTSRLISIFITYIISGRLVSIATTRGNVSQTNAIELMYCTSSMRPLYNLTYNMVWLIFPLFIFP